MKSFLHSINFTIFLGEIRLKSRIDISPLRLHHLTDTVLKSSQEEISVTSVNQENLEKAC